MVNHIPRPSPSIQPTHLPHVCPRILTLLLRRRRPYLRLANAPSRLRLPASLDLLLRDVPNLDVGTLREFWEEHRHHAPKPRGPRPREDAVTVQVETLERRIEHYEIQHPNVPRARRRTCGWVRPASSRGEAPHIAELFLTPSYDIEDPPEPLPGWFRSLLMGPHGQFNILREEVARLDDWSALAELLRTEPSRINWPRSGTNSRSSTRRSTGCWSDAVL
ncbi:hypothetical protein BGY98DRAFT_1104192 [Russula aff. rugulosa BPL654]|nr:hypothetical protein BGY98DRAFT_1104192 [Russula aff. rugulosa BPL654]